MADSGKLPVRHSSRFSNELVEDARRLFEQRMGRPLTNEDARQMLENLTGYFMTLHEWDRKSRNAESAADPAAELRSRTARRLQTPSETLLREGREER
jgi:hypothetical protein